MHALIIEDEAIIAMAIEDALRDCGFTSFSFATTVEAAVASAHSHCPDLITADVQLAPGSGIEAIEAICSDKPLPVVFITATGSEVREKFPDPVLVAKPFGSADVIEAVRRARSRLP